MLPGAHRQQHQRASGWAIYWYAWRGGPNIGRFTGATLAEAEQAEIAGAAEIAAGYGRETKPRPADGTVARAVTAFLQSPKWASYAFKTQQAWRPHLEHITETWGHLSGEEFASDAAAAEVGAWRDTLAERSPATADKAMGALSRLCSWARGRAVGLLPRDCKPASGIESAYTRPTILPPPRADVLDALSALPPLASAICEIAVHSGLRRSDLVLLSDPQIDVAAGIIRLGTKKGQRHRRVAVIDLKPPLLAAIRKAQAIRDARYAELMSRPARKDRAKPAKPLTVLVNLNCRAFTADGLYQHVRSAFEMIERDRINPHAFRRASATQKFLNGLSWARIGRELGWSEREAETMGAIYAPDEGLELSTDVSIPVYEVSRP